MRFWWVNQNQAFEQETRGGYLWSPKRYGNLGPDSGPVVTRLVWLGMFCRHQGLSILPR